MQKGQKASEATKQKIREARIRFKERNGGYINSEESRKKISESNKGKKAWNKGKAGRFENQNTEGLNKGRGWNKGQRLGFVPKEAFKKGQIPHNKGKRQLSTSGEKNHMWKGGTTALNKKIRSSFEYRQWRCDVFTRDKYTCLCCGKKGAAFHADHIEPFAIIISRNMIKKYEEALKCEELWNINNGQTLCHPCHKNKTREDRVVKKYFSTLKAV